MNEDLNLVTKALEFAKIAHAGQKRLNGEDFINHPIRVKNLLEEIGINDEKTLASAILHATMKVAGISKEEISKEFGEEIAFLLETLDNASDIILEKNETQSHSLHKLIIQMSKDIRVLLIRLADRVDNINTAHVLPTPDQKWIAQKAFEVYAPIAKAVGVYTFTRQLENQALKILEPQRYKRINDFLNNKFKNAEKHLNKASSEIEAFLKKEKLKYEISYRKKSIYSVHKKSAYGFDKGDFSSSENFDELKDLLGIMIKVENSKTCYEILAYIQQKWPIIQDEFDDYIAKPKQNGYKSLQVAIEIEPKLYCEIQMKTFEMHTYNEFGPASHLGYKYGGNKSGFTSAEWIKELIDQKDEINTTTGKGTRIKLFENEIFVF
ncbi:hypothetical protein CO178_02495, partial [candidate division WWE3 bacterium CG_4_9_14_3_um_filter_34_6]